MMLPRTLVLCAALFPAGVLHAQEKATPDQAPAKLATEVLDAQQWKQLDESVERALTWLVSQQKKDGSFPTLRHGQPGVTSLCLLAFLSQGHVPGEGKYGKQLKLSLDYIISCQKRSGILAAAAPDREKISRSVDHETGYTLVYNHAIAGLALSECFAMAEVEQNEKIKTVIQKAIVATYQMQDFPRSRKVDEGGWRYLDIAENVDADLSVTAWQLMFMRSAKNAGFEVEQSRIERALKYVHRCFLKDRGTFTYKVGFQDRPSRGVAGAGILAMAHAGLHETPEAQKAGDWILKSGFQSYNNIGKVRDIVHSGDRYHYGLLTCSQAMDQLGGRHWREFFPPTVRVLIKNQNPDGSWKSEKMHNDGRFGNAYTTAISVLALSACNDILPIFQR